MSTAIKTFKASQALLLAVLVMPSTLRFHSIEPLSCMLASCPIVYFVTTSRRYLGFSELGVPSWGPYYQGDPTIWGTIIRGPLFS